MNRSLQIIKFVTLIFFCLELLIACLACRYNAFGSLWPYELYFVIRFFFFAWLAIFAAGKGHRLIWLIGVVGFSWIVLQILLWLVMFLYIVLTHPIKLWQL